MGDGATQLTKIAASAAWRPIHLSIAFGYVVALAGLAGLAGLHTGTPGAQVARVGVTLAGFGYAVSALGVLFMLGAAAALAEAHARSVLPGTAADATFLYETFHPSALAALRIGAFAVSLGIAALGWAVRLGRRWRRWVGESGFWAGCLGAVVALLGHEHSPAIVAGVGLGTLWQFVVGVLLLRGSRAAPSDGRPQGVLRRPGSARCWKAANAVEPDEHGVVAGSSMALAVEPLLRQPRSKSRHGLLNDATRELRRLRSGRGLDARAPRSRGTRGSRAYRRAAPSGRFKRISSPAECSKRSPRL